MARLAEQSERYEDMITYMTRVANMGSELSVEERNLLSVAFKNAVGARRSAWRAIVNMMSKDAAESSPFLPGINGYKAKVEAELNAKCEEILNLISKDGGFIATATNQEAQVFFMKMEGDYYRYLAEFSTGDAMATHAAKALAAYTRAREYCTGLPPSNPIVLGLALNFSVFYFEVYKKADEACTLARTCFDAAVEEVHKLPEADQRDSTAILTLLRDNLQLWQQELQAGHGEGKPPEMDGTACEDL